MTNSQPWCFGVMKPSPVVVPLIRPAETFFGWPGLGPQTFSREGFFMGRCTESYIPYGFFNPKNRGGFWEKKPTPPNYHPFVFNRGFHEIFTIHFGVPVFLVQHPYDPLLMILMGETVMESWDQSSKMSHGIHILQLPYKINQMYPPWN